MNRVTVVASIQGPGSTNHVGLNSTQSKDRQLILILFVDVSVYIICSVILSVALMYQQVANDQTASLFDAQVISFLLATGTFCNFIPYCIVFYTNILISKTFRSGVKSVFLCK